MYFYALGAPANPEMHSKPDNCLTRSTLENQIPLKMHLIKGTWIPGYLITENHKTCQTIKSF